MARTTTWDFLGLSGDDGKYALSLTDQLIGPQGSLFGGAGIAAGVATLGSETGLAPIWATGQYVARTSPDEKLVLTVELPAVGRTVTQARIVGRIADKEVITIIGACGSGRSESTGIWQERPDAPDPDDCILLERGFEGPTVHDHVEVRVAVGMFGFSGIGTPSGDDSTVLWIRLPGVTLDSAALSLMGDYMASALGNALGRITFGSSLDNTVRFANPIPEDHDVKDDGWVLSHNRMEFIGNGIAFGSSTLWTPSGTLLAAASQSIVVRDA